MNWSTTPEPAKLAQLLDIESNTEWSGEDPASVLKGQLDAPLLPDLAIVPGTDIGLLKQLLAPDTQTKSFLEYLSGPNVVPEVLLAIKSFARHIGKDKANPSQGDPALVLYFAAIASGLVNGYGAITTLSSAALKEGFRWACFRNGAERLQPLFQRAMDSLS